MFLDPRGMIRCIRIQVYYEKSSKEMIFTLEEHLNITYPRDKKPAKRHKSPAQKQNQMGAAYLISFLLCENML